MKISHVVVLLIRVFAIALVLHSIENLIMVISFYFSAEHISYFGLTYYLSLILVAVLLWFLPYSVVGILTGYHSKENDTKSSVTAEQISSIVFIALGTYLLFNVISDTSYWLYVINNVSETNSAFQLTEDNKASIFSTAAEAVFVLCLFLGRKGFVKFLIKIRS